MSKSRPYNLVFLRFLEGNLIVMSLVRFNYADINPLVLKRKRIIREYIAGIFIKEGKKLKLLDYIFC